MGLGGSQLAPSRDLGSHRRRIWCSLPCPALQGAVSQGGCRDGEFSGGSPQIWAAVQQCWEFY